MSIRIFENQIDESSSESNPRSFLVSIIGYLLELFT